MLREVKRSALPESRGFSHSSLTGAQADGPIGRSRQQEGLFSFPTRGTDMNNDTAEHSEAAGHKTSTAASTSTTSTPSAISLLESQASQSSCYSPAEQG